jgi:hypothetical protein
MNPKMKAHTLSLSTLAIFLHSALPASADFQPLSLTPDSYNKDVVVEKGAPPPVVPVTTASMDKGLADSGYNWFERGYVTDWPATGLPEAGTVLMSDRGPDHLYQMPLSYQTNNAWLIDATRQTAVITLSTPTNCTALSFLTSSGGNRNQIRYTVHYGELSSETGVFVSPNWYDDGDPAWAANGCVNIATFSRSDLNSYNPRLYQADIVLSNAVGPVTSIELALGSGSGHTAIFAVSSTRSPGDMFNPLAITGQTEDLVVEAGAIKPGFMQANTTATMENGRANTRFTWYEQGYYSPAPQSGLPPAGSKVVSESDPSHQFVMPPSYTNANAIMVDADSGKSILTPAKPATFRGLSFLTASGHGPVTNLCVIRHLDGSSETNSFVSPDWMAFESAAAFRSGGRISVSTKLADSVNSDRPALYAVDVPVTHSNSAITKIELSLKGAGPDAHCVVFAVSGTTSSINPIRPALAITRAQNGQLTFRSSQPGRLQSCAAVPGERGAWRDEGPILQGATLPSPADTARFYRVMAQ